MSESDTQLKIDQLDFGFNLSQNAQPQNPSPKKKFSLKNIFRKRDGGDEPSGKNNLLQTLKKLAKTIFTIFIKTKWRVSRSIFLGRGVYFKYISNFSIVIILVFGCYVYLGSTSKSGKTNFFSKYAGTALANESIVSGGGAPTDVTQKQFNIVKYKVGTGVSLSSIAQKFSTPDTVISVDTIMWANGLQNDFLKSGMILDIPPVSGVLHIAQSGENPTDILKKYGKISDKSSSEEVNGALQEFTDINLLEVKVDGDTRTPIISPGSKYIVPGGVIAEAPKPQVAQAKPTPKPQQPVANVPKVVPGVPNANLIWPVAGGRGIISQYYSGFHTAIDVADSSGPPLVALANGTIVFAGWQSGGGANVVMIKYDNGYSSLYAHLQNRSFRVSAGDRVVQGQVVGLMGCTGSCTGTHVHFSLFYNGQVLNPINYVKR